MPRSSSVRYRRAAHASARNSSWIASMSRVMGLMRSGWETGSRSKPCNLHAVTGRGARRGITTSHPPLEGGSKLSLSDREKRISGRGDVDAGPRPQGAGESRLRRPIFEIDQIDVLARAVFRDLEKIDD